MDKSCNVIEVSLKDAILHAHEYRALRGELHTQDVAVMRLILAILHTVISRYDEDGDENALEDDEGDALDRWKTWWDKGKFPEKSVTEYISKWHERFWLIPLFHSDGLVQSLNNKVIYGLCLIEVFKSLLFFGIGGSSLFFKFCHFCVIPKGL